MTNACLPKIRSCHTALRRSLLVGATVAFSAVAVVAFLPASAQAQSAKRPSKLIHLQSGMLTFSFAAVDSIDGSGTNQGAFTVPVGQVFVMTSLTVTRGGSSINPSNPTLATFVLADGTTPRLTLKLQTGKTHHFVYPSGIVFGPGSVITSRALNTFSSDEFLLNASGYLAPDV